MTGWFQHHREPFGLISFPGAKLNGPGNRCLAIVAVNIQMQLLPPLLRRPCGHGVVLDRLEPHLQTALVIFRDDHRVLDNWLDLQQRAVERA